MRRCIARLFAVGLCLAMSGHAWGQVAELAPNEPRKPGDPQVGPIGAPHNAPHNGPHGPRFDVSKLPIGKTIIRQSEREARIRAALEEPAVFELKDTTLGDLVKQIEQKHKISVVLDIPALTADGYGTDTLLTPQVREITLRGGLHAILDSGYTMTFLVQDDALYITTKTAAETITPTRIYQVHDLVVAPTQPDGRPDFEQLTDLITAIIYPESWREAGGTQGEIKKFEAAGMMVLVVTHTYEVHEQLEHMLGSLRDAKLPTVADLQSRRQGSPPPPKQQPFIVAHGIAYPAPHLSQARPAGTPDAANQAAGQGPPQGRPRFDLSKLPAGKTVFHQSAAEAKVRAALDTPAGFAAKETTLGEFAKQIAEKHKISVVLYEAPLVADGRDASTVLTPLSGEGSLRTKLRATLDELALTAVVRDDALFITTRIEAETVTPTRIYQVHDLIVAPNKPEAWPEFDRLTDVITSIMAQETWRESGGTQGEIKPFEAAGMMALVVTQTEAVHEQIEELLANLRAAKLPGVAELQSHRREPRPEPPTAAKFYNPMAVEPANGGQPAATPPANPQPSGTRPAGAAPSDTAPSEAPKKGGNFFRLHDERATMRSGE